MGMSCGVLVHQFGYPQHRIIIYVHVYSILSVMPMSSQLIPSLPRPTGVKLDIMLIGINVMEYFKPGE